MRKVVQIAVKPRSGSWQAMFYALCDDGTIWVTGDTDTEWGPVQNVPQDDPKPARAAGQEGGA